MGALEQAQAMADARFNPQQDAVNRRLGLINQQTGIRNDAVQTMGVKGRENLGGVYDTLNGLLGNNKTQAMGSLAIQGNQIGQGYRDANAIQEQLRTTSRDSLATLAERMNAGSYAMPGLAGIESTANELIGANAQRDATATGNLRNWAGQAGSIYDAQVGTGHQMRADALSRLETDLVRATSENNLSGAEQSSDIQDQLMELLGERGAYLAEQVNQLSQQEWERSVQQAQLDQETTRMSMSADQANAELGLKSRAMDMEGQMSEKDKLAMQLQAWGMQNDQSNADRDYGLESNKLSASMRDPGQSISEKLGIMNAINSAESPEDRWRIQQQLSAMGLYEAPTRNWGGRSNLSSLKNQTTGPTSAPKGAASLPGLRSFHATVMGR